jgi:hypothetical protein
MELGCVMWRGVKTQYDWWKPSWEVASWVEVSDRSLLFLDSYLRKWEGMKFDEREDSWHENREDDTEAWSFGDLGRGLELECEEGVQ